MHVIIEGSDPRAVHDVKCKVESLIDRAGASRKPPPVHSVLVDVAHSGCAKLVLADLEAFHVCKNSRDYFVLQAVPEPTTEAPQPRSDDNKTYVYDSNHRSWEVFLEGFRRFHSETPDEKLSSARVSVRLGKLFFWRPRLGRLDSQKPGAIHQLSYKDCRGQFAARLKSAVGKKFTEILKKSEFSEFRQRMNITFYIKPEGNGDKREITFFDPTICHERSAEMTRLWGCTSHADVLKLSLERPPTRKKVELASRTLQHLLHPSHNEFKGCEHAMDIINQASQVLSSERPSSCPIRLLSALKQKPWGNSHAPGRSVYMYSFDSFAMHTWRIRTLTVSGCKTSHFCQTSVKDAQLGSAWLIDWRWLRTLLYVFGGCLASKGSIQEGRPSAWNFYSIIMKMMDEDVFGIENIEVCVGFYA